MHPSLCGQGEQMLPHCLQGLSVHLRQLPGGQRTVLRQHRGDVSGRVLFQVRCQLVEHLAEGGKRPVAQHQEQ